MKQIITKKLIGLALSVFSISAQAQTSSCTASFTSYTDTNCVTHFINNSTGSSLTYEWYDMNSFTLLSTSANPSLNLTNGTYAISLYSYSGGVFCDTINQVITVGCGSSTTTPSGCTAGFTSYTDSSCITHFINTTTGSGLTYEWYDMNSFTLLSTSANPSLNLTNGTYTISLYSYSGGVFCDTINQVITVGCGSGTTTPSGCTAGFTSYTDSSCVTHFINTTTGSNLSYEWYNMTGNGWFDVSGWSLISTSANPALSLPNGTYSITLMSSSNGTYCDSINQVITVGCGTSTTSPSGCAANASFAIFADSTNAGNYFAYNLSSGTGSLSYFWDFGDGTTSTQQYPFHNYSVPGNYIVCLTVTASSGTATCTDTHCDSSSVTLRITSGFLMSQLNIIAQSTDIKQHDLFAGLSTYPNPMADELTIEVSATDKNKLTYSITDALGRIVLTGNLEGNKTLINTSNLQNGFYSLNIYNENSAKTSIKLVK